MSNNNPQAADVNAAADVSMAAVMSTPPQHGAASNGNGLAASTPAVVETRFVSGLYEGLNAKAGTDGEIHLDLRVDVDGDRATRNVSGDLFKRSGFAEKDGVVVRWDSFIIGPPRQITFPAGKVVISGKAEYAVSRKNTNVVVEVARAGEKPTATVTFTRVATGVVEETFECAFASEFFRTVEYEIDRMDGTEVFDTYDTASLKSGGPGRVLSLPSAYEEAGIKLTNKGDSDVVLKIPESLQAKPDGKWSDTELHDSMLTHFSLVDRETLGDPGRERQWRLWLFVANEHEQGLRGVMFDSHWDRARQGCAVFYDAIKGNDPERKNEALRGALRTYVHEVGHCLNLAHSWEKSKASPPQEDRPDALSYMNYVENYSGGQLAYWERFAFEFDAGELFHLRHAFRNNIIMGGEFGTGTSEPAAPGFGRRARYDSGLELRLEARRTFVMCEPLAVELKLYRKGDRRKRVHASIHPDRGFVHLAIRKPDGSVVPYRPFVTRCADPEFTVLDREQPSIYASAYVGYGKDGFYFDRAGVYKLVAVYHSPCGAKVVSEPLAVRVRHPLDRAEEEIADLYYGDDQGKLFYLFGSDSKHLASGRKSLDNVIDRYYNHPLSVHAHLVKGINAGRRFKSITADDAAASGKRLSLRAPRSERSRDLLSGVVESSMRSPHIDNITLNMCARRLARAHRRLGDQGRAEDTLRSVISYFRRLRLKRHVLERIEAQAYRTLHE